MVFPFTSSPTSNLSEVLYKWIVDPRGTDSGETFMQVFSNANPMTGHGMEASLFLLIAVSLASALIYYFVVAANILNATKKNYVTTWIVGYVFLVVLNFLVLQFGVPEIGVFDSNVLPNLIKISLIDAVYYTLLFEIWSVLCKGASKASNIELYSALFK